MARIARFVVPGLPHHITQRGTRCERVFFAEDDYALYRDLLASQCRKNGVSVRAYCLMPNHVHLILVPDRAEALGRALGERRRRYSSTINARLGATGRPSPLTPGSSPGAPFAERQRASKSLP